MAARRTKIAALALASLLVALAAQPGAAGATPIFQRVPIGDAAFGADATDGNFWHFVDRIDNVSGGPVVVREIEVLLLNPEDLGFADVEASNGLAVLAAAQAAHPGFLFGILFWQADPGDPNPQPVNVPAVNWVFAEGDVGGSTATLVPGAPVVIDSPFVLGPGGSFFVNLFVHNDILGAPASADRIGELVYGFRITPEPSTAVLLGLGLVGLVGATRRRAR